MEFKLTHCRDEIQICAWGSPPGLNSLYHCSFLFYIGPIDHYNLYHFHIITIPTSLAKSPSQNYLWIHKQGFLTI